MASTAILKDVRLLADELVRASRHATPGVEALSLLDQAETASGSQGIQLVLKSSVAAPMLKDALVEVLSASPSLAGRLVQAQDGAFDVACCNAGARLVIASSSATLAEVEAALGHVAVPAKALNPWAAFSLPSVPETICLKQLPLASVFLLHLRGGGALLALSVYAPLVDFESLQALAGALSVAYNAATRSREMKLSGAAAPVAAAAAAAAEAAVDTAATSGAGGGGSSVAAKPDSHCGSGLVSRTGSRCSMDSARSVCSSIGIAPFAPASSMAAAASMAAALAAPCASCGGGAAATAAAAAAVAAATSSRQLRTLSSHPFVFEEITWEEEEGEDGDAVAGCDTAASSAAAADTQQGSPSPLRRSASAAVRQAASAAASSVVSACCAACRTTYNAAAAASPGRLAAALAVAGSAAAEQLPSPFAAQRATAAAAAAATAVPATPAATASVEEPRPAPMQKGAALRADEVEALAVEGPLPQGVPERPDRLLVAVAAPAMAAGWKWATSALLAARSLLYMDVLGRGCEVRLLRLPDSRLAELKAQATAELAQEKEWEESHVAAHAAGGCCGCSCQQCPALRDVEWVSSNDVLCARLMQLLHSTPLRQLWPTMVLLRPADLRRRRSLLLPAAAPPALAAVAGLMPLGNASYPARLEAVAPSCQSLGRLAAQLRQSLGHVVPQLRRSLAQARAASQQARAAAAAAGASSGGGALLLLPGSAAASHPLECGVSPVGPLTVAALDVQPDLMKFGPDPPVAMLPLDGSMPPNTVLAYPAGPASPSTCLAVALHRVTWRHLDVMYGNDLAAAL
ncbi:hypothetical protein HXX76_000794 [Chlamydomonas incerta]|uniref:Uncharacterized protein n=1 Tax=Chlamydomonas incerta TaxID=51695 RepID=A0A835WF14_CHLIN|nr:hypothetical protein HXX76_000794 [Chlamydomonas incerta]|eukprot:KAG2446201.1 hypothetical protein HXX76_000794 [Chlamydomonas incerta]